MCTSWPGCASRVPGPFVLLSMKSCVYYDHMQLEKQIRQAQDHMLETGVLQRVVVYIDDAGNTEDVHDRIFVVIECVFTYKSVFIVSHVREGAFHITSVRPDMIDHMARHEYTDEEPWKTCIGYEPARTWVLVDQNRSIHGLQWEFGGVVTNHQHIQIQSFGKAVRVVYGGKETVLW